ncbi:MAG TPA: response regulator [Ktedonobacterales bacterium]|nr:response regulator [Ktedonobacterales bacterium]
MTARAERARWQALSFQAGVGDYRYWGAANMAQVLIVDDDENIRDAVRLILEDAGHTVMEASDGVTALRILRESQERLIVLLDMSIPRLNGVDLLSAVVADPFLKERYAYLLLTGSGERLRREAGPLLAEASARIVAKPFEIADLLALIDDAAERLSA